jgi:hypothetical protein
MIIAWCSLGSLREAGSCWGACNAPRVPPPRGEVPYLSFTMSTSFTPLSIHRPRRGGAIAGGEDFTRRAHHLKIHLQARFAACDLLPVHCLW